MIIERSSNQTGVESRVIKEFRANQKMRKQIRVEAKRVYAQMKQNDENVVSWRSILMTVFMMSIGLAFFTFLAFSLPFLSLF